jgi:hypothetical protein|uniref:Uncharacterized protein n=1 Tax=Zea mays TaxID=4577 RepID=A0A804MI40_MAIZE
MTYWRCPKDGFLMYVVEGLPHSRVVGVFTTHSLYLPLDLIDMTLYDGGGPFLALSCRPACCSAYGTRTGGIDNAEWDNIRYGCAVWMLDDEQHWKVYEKEVQWFRDD